MGPRGIVAAGIASLFGIKLSGQVEGAELVTPLVFMIVLGTVLLNATTAGTVAKWLKVTLDSSDGILIVGINPASKFIAKYLRESGRHVALIDNNFNSVEKAKKEGLDAYQHNVYADEIGDNLDFLDVGYLLAMTSSPEVNKFTVQKFQEEFGENGTYRLISPEEMHLEDSKIPNEGLFSKTDDYINLGEIVRDDPYFHEIEITATEQFPELVQGLSNTAHSIPLFIRKKDGMVRIITANITNMNVQEGDVLIYAGREMKDLAVTDDIKEEA